MEILALMQYRFSRAVTLNTDFRWGQKSSNESVETSLTFDTYLVFNTIGVGLYCGINADNRPLASQYYTGLCLTYLAKCRGRPSLST